MTFSADGLAFSLQSSFELGGAADLDEFILRHLGSRRWIIASDFNLGSEGAAHDVYAFAAYPADVKGYTAIASELTKIIPKDFKRTRRISRDLKNFFSLDNCFCFVILAPKQRMTFNDHSEHKANLVDAQTLLHDMVNSRDKVGMDPKIVADVRRFRQASQKKDLTLKFIEQILIFTIANAFASCAVGIRSRAELIGWFPDRDNMTTYADCVWESLAHLNFHGFWTQRFGTKPPFIGVMNHRIHGTNEIYDPLIRVPDFLAATFSRWHLEKRVLTMPQGTSDAGKSRYRQIIRCWAADNPNLWIGRIFRDDHGHYRCSRIAATKSKKRGRRLQTQDLSST